MSNRFLIVITAMLFAMTGFAGQEPSKEPPKKIADLKDGWATYRFADLKLDIDLPSSPDQSEISGIQGISAGVVYSFHSESARFEIKRTWYIPGTTDSADRQADEMAGYLLNQSAAAKVANRRTVYLGDQPAIELEVDAPEGKNTTVTLVTVTANGSGMFEINQTFYNEWRGLATADRLAVLSSMHPTDPSLPRNHIFGASALQSALPETVSKLKDLGDGWATYRFSDLKLDIDLPTPPTALPKTPDESALGVHDSDYQSVKGEFEFDLSRTWYDNMTPDLAMFAKSQRDGFNIGFPGIKQVSTTSLHFGDLPAIQSESTGMTRGRRAVHLFLCAADGTGGFIVVCHFWDSERKPSVAMWHRIFDSMKPSDPKLNKTRLLEASEPQQKLPNAVRKVKDLAGGWSLYRFSDFGLDVELPGQPFHVDSDASDMALESSAYGVLASSCQIILARGEFQKGKGPALAALSDSEDVYVIGDNKGVTKAPATKVKFGDQPALQKEYRNNSGPAPASSIVLCASDRTGCVIFRITFWDADRKAGLADWQRVFASMRPSDPKLSKNHLLITRG